MSNLLFQVKNKEKVISQAGKVLRDGGKLLIIDWQPDATLGPQGLRVKAPEIKALTEKLGFALEKEIPAGAYHWALLFVKL
jgi:SAM-dependent methyltransferase